MSIEVESSLKINYKKIAKLIGYAALTVVAIYLAIKLAVFYLPFLIAYIIYKIIKKPVTFLNAKLKIPKKLAVVFCMVIVVSVIGGIGYLFFSSLISEIIALSQESEHLLAATAGIKTLISRFTSFYNSLELDPEILATIQSSFETTIQNISSKLGEFVETIISGTYNVVRSLPQVLVYVIITFLATFFISSDTQFISESLEKHLPTKWLHKISKIMNDLFAALGGYVKAQCIMMSITCFELFIFFTFYRIEYALILAIVIAIIDALPILGTGTVLIPWALFNLATGNYRMGIYLVILYLFVTVVRQLIEPKVVGTQIGIYPLLTLIAMYTGVRTIGVFGLIVGPIVLIILKSILSGIYKRGMIKDLFELEQKA